MSSTYKRPSPMAMLRLHVVVAFARLLGVPIKVREAFWFPDDGRVSSGHAGEATPHLQVSP